MIGHRETSERVYPALEKTVRSLAEKGVKEFFVGQYGSFVALAAHAVKQVKKTYADTKWILLLVCCSFERSDRIPAGLEYFPICSGICSPQRCNRAGQSVDDASLPVSCLPCRSSEQQFGENPAGSTAEGKSDFQFGTAGRKRRDSPGLTCPSGFPKKFSPGRENHFSLPGFLL